jgi:hypothetical protein
MYRDMRNRLFVGSSIPTYSRLETVLTNTEASGNMFPVFFMGRPTTWWMMTMEYYPRMDGRRGILAYPYV